MIKIALGQSGKPPDEILLYAKQLGCDGMVIHVPAVPFDKGYWEYDHLARFRERINSFELELYSLENTRWDMYEDCMVGGPNRDRQLENYQRTITNMGRAGIGTLGFCWMPNSVWSSSFESESRGGALVRTFDYRDHEKAELTHGRIFDEDEMWELFSDFINAVAPVAEEAGVTLALHPDDPPVESLGGIARIFRSFEGFQKATEEVCTSPAFKLNFCMGTWSEMRPGEALHAMKYFAERDKLAYVHFRDVKGHVPVFEECFIGDGNIDPVEAMLILKNAGYDGFVEEDHVPRTILDMDYWAERGRAYSTGYIQGMARAVWQLG